MCNTHHVPIQHSHSVSYWWFHMHEQMEPSPKPKLGKLWITLEISVKWSPFWALPSSPQPLFQSISKHCLSAKQWNFIKYGYKMQNLTPLYDQTMGTGTLCLPYFADISIVSTFWWPKLLPMFIMILGGFFFFFNKKRHQKWTKFGLWNFISFNFKWPFFSLHLFNYLKNKINNKIFDEKVARIFSIQNFIFFVTASLS